jgi:hypothetical protein
LNRFQQCRLGRSSAGFIALDPPTPQLCVESDDGRVFSVLQHNISVRRVPAYRYTLGMFSHFNQPSASWLNLCAALAARMQWRNLLSHFSFQWSEKSTRSVFQSPGFGISLYSSAIHHAQRFYFKLPVLVESAHTLLPRFLPLYLFFLASDQIHRAPAGLLARPRPQLLHLRSRGAPLRLVAPFRCSSHTVSAPMSHPH